MSDPRTNPYAPPQADAGPGITSPSGEPVSSYSGQRRSVLLCIGLTIVTLGLYPPIWILRRRPFLNALDSSDKLGTVGPSLYLIGSVLALVLPFVGTDGANVGRGISGLTALVGVIVAFRVVRILRSDFRRTGRMLDASYGWAFFFGVYYLQYKINQGAERPARVAPAT